ncbi:MAG TPA: cytochrome c peroxidase [Labilithrix sp.]|nr:cytochrome c peroxidase [Labilithrix sp.]
MRSRRSVHAALLLLSIAAAACDKKPDAPPVPATATPPAPGTAPTPAAEAPKGRPFDPAQLAVFAALPEKIERPDNLLTDDKVALGRQLYFDARLSRGHDVSCNSCHDVTRSGAGDTPVPDGTKKAKGTRNAPTIFNAAGNFAQGWDGRGPLVEDFIGPHAAEASVMNADEKRLVDTVGSMPAYVAAFKKAFPDDQGAVTGASIAKALAAYSRKLLTPGRWDKFLGGDQGALTDDEKIGLGAFMDAGCTACHAGKYVGGAQNQKLGVAKPWPATADVGRFGVTKQEVDRFVFKVPTLRNVTKTGPYLHDGSVASLDELVKLMARHQMGKDLTDAQTRSIVAYLGALGGEAPKELVKKPDLPPAGPKTPKPE